MSEAGKIAEAPRRRSARILMRIPLFVNMAGHEVPTEWEPVVTILVSKHGGLIRTRQGFQIGVTLDMRMQNKDRWTKARVVWRSPRSNGQGYDLGFEIMDDPTFWEIDFPPDRWSEQTRPKAYSH